MDHEKKLLFNDRYTATNNMNLRIKSIFRRASERTPANETLADYEYLVRQSTEQLVALNRNNASQEQFGFDADKDLDELMS